MTSMFKESRADADQEGMSRFLVARSARLLVWGVVLLVLGQVAIDAGRQQALDAALRPALFRDDSAGSGATTVGSLLGLVGLILLVNGIFRLATNIDYLAAREAHVEHAEDRGAGAGSS